MASSNARSRLGAGRAVRRMVASVVSRAGLIISLTLLLLAVAACGDDDDGTRPGQETGSPTSSLQTTAGPSPTDNGGSGQASPTPTSSAGEQTPPPGKSNSGTAIIVGVQYDFTTALCAITPSLVSVLGTGTAPDGRPFIASASWTRVDSLGNEDAVDVGIHTNVVGLLDPADQAFRIGNRIANSTVDSIEIDVTGFDLTISGKFVDDKVPEAPPVEGSFTVSCN